MVVDPRPHSNLLTLLIQKKNPLQSPPFVAFPFFNLVLCTAALNNVITNTRKLIEKSIIITHFKSQDPRTGPVFMEKLSISRQRQIDQTGVPLVSSAHNVCRF